MYICRLYLRFSKSLSLLSPNTWILISLQTYLMIINVTHTKTNYTKNLQDKAWVNTHNFINTGINWVMVRYFFFTSSLLCRTLVKFQHTITYCIYACFQRQQGDSCILSLSLIYWVYSIRVGASYSRNRYHHTVSSSFSYCSALTTSRQAPGLIKPNLYNTHPPSHPTPMDVLLSPSPSTQFHFNPPGECVD